ncbi:hypothetical protein EV132_1321, partial [Rhizobium sullae]
PEMACESNPVAGRKQEEDGSSPRANAAVIKTGSPVLQGGEKSQWT